MRVLTALFSATTTAVKTRALFLQTRRQISQFTRLHDKKSNFHERIGEDIEEATNYLRTQAENAGAAAVEQAEKQVTIHTNSEVERFNKSVRDVTSDIDKLRETSRQQGERIDAHQKTLSDLSLKVNTNVSSTATIRTQLDTLGNEVTRFNELEQKMALNINNLRETNRQQGERTDVHQKTLSDLSLIVNANVSSTATIKTQLDILGGNFKAHKSRTNFGFPILVLAITLMLICKLKEIYDLLPESERKIGNLFEVFSILSKIIDQHTLDLKKQKADILDLRVKQAGWYRFIWTEPYSGYTKDKEELKELKTEIERIEMTLGRR